MVPTLSDSPNPEDCVCPDVWEPVECGGIEYGNECEAECGGCSVGAFDSMSDVKDANQDGEKGIKCWGRKTVCFIAACGHCCNGYSKKGWWTGVCK